VQFKLNDVELDDGEHDPLERDRLALTVRQN
jgi:hypothetical protein